MNTRCNAYPRVKKKIVANLSPAQFNFNSVGWAKLVLFNFTPTPNPQESNKKAISIELLVGPSLTDD